jgi:hypothetical protein
MLIGAFDQASLKELLQTKLVKVIVHDCDEYVKNNDATFGVGQATFTFKDFLRPFTRDLTLRSDVFPMKRQTVDDSKILDLNATARKNDKNVELSSPYLINMTYCIVQASLAYPIGPFDENFELHKLSRA